MSKHRSSFLAATSAVHALKIQFISILIVMTCGTCLEVPQYQVCETTGLVCVAPSVCTESGFNCVQGCGNGQMDRDEVCDDGNLLSGDGCSSDCKSNETCGNGIRDIDEECDVGDADSSEGCDDNCTFKSCGDGYRDTGESCDDGNHIDGDRCSANCLSDETCGNGYVDGNQPFSEECDDGNATDGDGCSRQCMDENCGNGVLDAEEVCDDGNTTDGDGCSANCKSFERCGDAILDLGEECDQGKADTIECDDDCTVPACGDGHVNAEAGEECEEDDDTATCDSDCTLPTCGDGYVNTVAGEQCDDGNMIDSDGCDSNCQSSETCGNGMLDPGEGCDDGTNNGDSDSCQPGCGGGIVALCDIGWINDDVMPGPGVCDSPTHPGESNWIDFDASSKVAPSDMNADLAKGHTDCCNWNVMNDARQLNTNVPTMEFDTLDCRTFADQDYTVDSLEYFLPTIICLKTASGLHVKYYSEADCCGGIQIRWAAQVAP